MALLMTGAMLTSLAGCAQGEPKINEDVLSMNSSVMNEKNVKPLGRTEFVDDMLWLAYSGSGAEFAFNLDGGGSTTLYFRGEVINMPSGGKERSVSDVIMFTAQ